MVLSYITIKILLFDYYSATKRTISVLFVYQYYLHKCYFILQQAKGEIEELELDLQELEELRLDLACYFCEDDTQFKLEECLRIFFLFCEKFKKAIEVNIYLENNINIIVVIIHDIIITCNVMII